METSIKKLLKDNALVFDRALEKLIPRAYTDKSLIQTLGPPHYDYSPEAINRALAEPIWEFLDRGGKRWRPTLFLLICEALGKNPDDLLDFAIIPEIIHNGTIMIDDIEDSSEFRRGKPCTHRLFGIDIAVNAGNTMYYLPLLTLASYGEKLPKETATKLYEIYVQEMVNISFGQATDIAWHKGLVDVDRITENQYLQMCILKTGTLARMSAKLAAVLAGADNDLTERIGRYAETIAVAFQIRDDILDLTGGRFSEGKGGFGQDITEGKRTLLVINSLSKAKVRDRRRLLEILDMHTADQTIKREAISIIERSGSIEYAKEYARDIVAEGWNEINQSLPQSKAKEKLRAFASYLVEREI